jgi:hypothetical protein
MGKKYRTPPLSVGKIIKLEDDVAQAFKPRIRVIETIRYFLTVVCMVLVDNYGVYG